MNNKPTRRMLRPHINIQYAAETSTQQPLLLIDGNNLAHFLYPNLTSRRRMTVEDTLQLIGHLSSYARNYGEYCSIELYLDRPPGNYPLVPGPLRIYPAEHPHDADHLIEERLRFHIFTRRPCLVVTSDERLMELVTEMGVRAVRVSDFVRRPGSHNPVFRDPSELANLFAPLENAPIQLVETTQLTSRLRITKNGKQNRPDRTALQKETPIHVPQLRQQKPEPLSPKPLEQISLPSGPAHPSVNKQPSPPQGELTEPDEDEPKYHLTLERWPVQEGIKILIDAFCPEHKEAHRELMQSFDRQKLTTDDLRGLAGLLVDSCGHEPDFSRRGTLIERVRLALLAAGGSLTFSKLAQSIGKDPTGLRRKIKDKAGFWMRIE